MNHRYSAKTACGLRTGLAFILASLWLLSCGSAYGAETAAVGALPAHWSLRPVHAPAVPHSRFDPLSANPVDRFIFAKLAERGLHPSAPADRRALLRRVSIDLTGLPPTQQEMAAFLQDRRPDAYERVVDRLLASPAYGERWGRHWLDVVRYGESHGYEQNHVRATAWHYRDYVIDAFNRDIPYPQFVAEQLAGDALATKRPEANAGTGFLVAGIHDTVGSPDEYLSRQQRANDLDDIVSTTGAAFLGLTVGCAKCHNHKFDPIPQRDFYRMEACFAGVRHGERPLYQISEAQQRETEKLHARLLEIRNRINQIDEEARRKVLSARAKSEITRPAVNARHNEDVFPPAGARFVRFTVLATNDGAEPCIDEIQIFGPGSSLNLAAAAAGAKASAGSLLPGYAIHQIAHLNDGLLGNEHSWISAERGTGWAQIELPMERQVNRVVWSRDAGEIPRFDDRLPVRYRIEVSRDGRSWSQVSTDAGRSGTNDYIHPDELQRQMTSGQTEQRMALQRTADDLQRAIAKVDSAGRAYIGQFTDPDPIFVLNRGDVMQRGEQVMPGALSAVTGLASDLVTDAKTPEPQRRLQLARWIANPANPLAARVFVNRIWLHHFGRGIVGTPSDFGANGERPTHPELLDWLAAAFVRPPGAGSGYAFGWRQKALHRLLVTSYTYRQDSRILPAAAAKDASNLYLWRMNLRRMEAEAVRDSILQTSGKLNRAMGGPGFALYQYNVVNVAIYAPLEEYGPQTWRRSVYQQAARGIRDDLLSAFDCPESSQRAPKRDSTTTALQALSLLNGPFIAQQARFFAERAQAEAHGDASKAVRQAFQLAFQRPPDAREERAARALIGRHGLTDLCRALLNANEFLYY